MKFKDTKEILSEGFFDRKKPEEPKGPNVDARYMMHEPNHYDGNHGSTHRHSFVHDVFDYGNVDSHETKFKDGKVGKFVHGDGHTSYSASSRSDDRTTPASFHNDENLHSEIKRQNPHLNGDQHMTMMNNIRDIHNGVLKKSDPR